KAAGAVFCRRDHRCGRLYRRIQPADRLVHGPGGGAGRSPIRCYRKKRNAMKKQLHAVAIDGPSGAGKSTLARAAAARLHFLYVDTGAIYRSIGWYALQQGVSLERPEEIEKL